MNTNDLQLQLNGLKWIFFGFLKFWSKNGQFWPHFEISIWMNEALFN